jgi:PAS domain S-box-containing protein
MCKSTPDTASHGESRATPRPQQSPTLDQLQERAAELESEASRLRHLEETIQRNTHLSEALLNNSSEGIALVTPEMTILKVVHGLMSHPHTDLCGQHILTFFHCDDAAVVKQAVDRLPDGQAHTARCECRAVDADGSERWLELHMTDLLDDPAVAAILFNYRDITQQKADRAAALQPASLSG